MNTTSHQAAQLESQVISSLRLAEALGTQHPFLIARLKRLIIDINNPAFTNNHFMLMSSFVETGAATYLLSDVAVKLLTLDLELDHALAAPDDDVQTVRLTQRLHGLIQQKRLLAAQGRVL